MWLEDFPAAQVLARKQKKLIFVDFTGSDWCPPCIALHRRVLSTKPFLDYAKDRFILVSVDFPHNKIQPDNLVQVNRILARAFEVESFPTVLILDVHGTELHRVTGYHGQSAADYIKSLTPQPKPPPKPTPPQRSITSACPAGARAVHLAPMRQTLAIIALLWIGIGCSKKIRHPPTPANPPSSSSTPSQRSTADPIRPRLSPAPSSKPSPRTMPRP